MDKKLILAVAGSGKTTYLINRLSTERRALIITYTRTNHCNLQNAIFKRFGSHPKNIHLFTYYTFIYSFCYRPLLARKFGANGMNWQPNPQRFAKGNDRFIDKHGRLYSNRIAAFLETQQTLTDIKIRVEKYFDDLYIDEVQDFAGHDFNFLKCLSATSVNCLFVGDYYQHTYDTSRDGIINGNLHADETTYIEQFNRLKLSIDNETLNKSYRCNPEICDFVTKRLGVDIGSHRNGGSSIVAIDSQADADPIIENQAIVKLFYQAHYKYNCFGKNWGESKGEDCYDDVCVVMNENTWKLYSAGRLGNLPPTTKSKLYVAITRTKGNLYLMPETLLKGVKKESI